MAGRQEGRVSVDMEESESVYFDEVSKFNDMCSLDQSADSLRGSVTFPTFSLAQSTMLQGSHGFQTGSQGEILTLNQSADYVQAGTQFQYVRPGACIDKAGNQETEIGSRVNEVANIQMCSGIPVSRMYSGGGVTYQTQSEQQSFTALKPQTGIPVYNPTGNQFQNLQFLPTDNKIVAQGENNADAHNIMTNSSELRHSAGIVQCVTTDIRSSIGSDTNLPPIPQESITYIQKKPTTDVRTEWKMDTEFCAENLEMTENAGSSDEKSQKTKMSPKRRGRRSKKASSIVNEPQSDIHQHTTSPCRLEACPSEPPASVSDGGFRAPLLDEILAEKKLALMRSPEVIRFLQSQQEKFVREKMNSPGDNS